jgi:hypothetical protein
MTPTAAVDLFPLGEVTVSLSADQAMVRRGIRPEVLVERHRRGEWGDVDEALRRENNAAVKHGFRVLSVYNLGGETFYIVTESDRSVTAIFLHEYY